MKFDHPFIMKLQFSFQDKEHLYLIMDFINGGELFYHLSQVG
jgi:serine/threonine protein kinase